MSGKNHSSIEDLVYEAIPFPPNAKYSLELQKELNVGLEQLYVALHKLEQEGFVEGYFKQSESAEVLEIRGGRKRRYYSRTRKRRHIPEEAKAKTSLSWRFA